jgi:predicted N-acetyltransferase YhbS
LTPTAQANPKLIGMLQARDSAIVSSEHFVIRPATTDDIKEMSGVLERAGLSSSGPEVLEFNLTSSSTEMFVGCRDGLVVGVAGCVRFGGTGWLGNVAVDDDFRGQGLGRAISQVAVDCLRQAGLETVLLTATKLGRPIYERLGFADEGVSYGIWEQQQSPALSCDHPAAVQPGQIDEVIRQDADATGEDRRSYLAPFADRARVVAGHSQAGYWLALPWGGGPVIAASRAAARPLIIDMIRTSPGARLAFPELNVHGAALAVSLGFHLARRVRRMRLGPPVPGYRPGLIYNAFSLAAG